MSNWIKASDDMPEVGRLVVVRSPSTEYDDDCKPYIKFEYDAGILIENKLHRPYVNVAHNEYSHTIEIDSEWQYLEE